MASRIPCTVLASLLLAGAAQADVLYSNLSGPTFASTSGPLIASASAPVAGVPTTPSFTFVAAASGQLAELRLSLLTGFPVPFPLGTPLLVASLWTSAIGCGTGVFSTACSNPVPMVQLGSWTFLDNTPNGTVTSISTPGTVALVAGTTYYLQMTAINNPGVSIATWAGNEVGAVGDYWDCGANDSTGACTGRTWKGTGFAMPGFALLSAAVPEPAIAFQLSLGLLACLGWRRTGRPRTG